MTSNTCATPSGNRPKRKRLHLAASLLALAGFGPILLNLLAWRIAAWIGNGCYIHEGEVARCALGPADVGEILHYAAKMGLLIILTWPLAIGALVLWAVLLVRWLRQSRSQVED